MDKLITLHYKAAETIGQIQIISNQVKRIKERIEMFKKEYFIDSARKHSEYLRSTQRTLELYTYNYKLLIKEIEDEQTRISEILL